MGEYSVLQPCRDCRVDSIPCLKWRQDEATVFPVLGYLTRPEPRMSDQVCDYWEAGRDGKRSDLE